MPFSTKDFPSTEDINRVASEHEDYKLYDCSALDTEGNTDRGKFRLKEFFENDAKKAKLLDIALNLAPLIVDTGTDFLFGEPVMIGEDGEGTLQTKIDEIMERNNLHAKFAESSALFQTVGHTHFKLYAKDNKAMIEEIPYSYWFPNWASVPLGANPDNVRLVAYLNNVENGVTTKYIYIEDYYMEGTAKIAKSLWTDQGGKIGQQVDLAKLDIATTGTLNGMTAIEDTELPELPIVELHVRKTALQRYGQSVLKKVRPLLNEINDRLTQLSVQFLKHLNAKLQIPDGSVARDTKTGAIRRVDMEVLIARAGEPEAKYITNENPLIEQAFVHLDKLIRAVAKLTQTPDSFLTEDEKGGVEKAEALKTRLMAFLKRIRLYQTRYEAAIKKLVKLALMIEGVKGADKAQLVITFDTGLPKDWEYDEKVWGDAVARGIASKETAVSRFQGISGDELKEELARIEEAEEKALTQLMEQTAQEPDGEKPPFGKGNDNPKDAE